MGSNHTGAESAPFSLCGVGRIPLKARRGTVRAWATVSLPDFQRLAVHRWRLGTGGYAVRQVRKDRGGQWTLGMHRAVMNLGYGDSLQVDHRNRKRLDNRRENLRLATPGLNCQNIDPAGLPNTSSRYRGVSWWASRGVWVAQAWLDRQHYFLGYYHDEHEAGAVMERWYGEHMPYASRTA